MCEVYEVSDTHVSGYERRPVQTWYQLVDRHSLKVGVGRTGREIEKGTVGRGGGGVVLIPAGIMYRPAET